MRCPKCGGQTHVYRTEKYDTTTFRVRQCVKCGHRAVTWESFDEDAQLPRRETPYADARAKSRRDAG